MAIPELIRHRRSCRKFTTDKISLEVINQLLETTLLSPTSKNNRPWEFIIVDEPALLLKLSELKPHGAAFMKDAALAIVIIADPLKSDVWIEDTAIAATVLQLYAEELGLGSCWIQIRKRDHNEGLSAANYVKETLNIPSDLEAGPIITLGYKQKDRKSYTEDDILKERIHWNKIK